MGKVLLGWNALANESVKCPVDGCQHLGNIITKAHLRMTHGLTREECLAEYGLPHRVLYKVGVMVKGY